MTSDKLKITTKQGGLRTYSQSSNDERNTQVKTSKATKPWKNVAQTRIGGKFWACYVIAHWACSRFLVVYLFYGKIMWLFSLVLTTLIREISVRSQQILWCFHSFPKKLAMFNRVDMQIWNTVCQTAIVKKLCLVEYSKENLNFLLWIKKIRADTASVLSEQKEKQHNIICI